MPPMIKQPDWAERIPRIRAALSDIATEFIDRRQLGELFGVSSSQAGHLIRSMGPMLHGNSLVVDAEDIRKLLSEMEKEDAAEILRRSAACSRSDCVVAHWQCSPTTWLRSRHLGQAPQNLSRVRLAEQ